MPDFRVTLTDSLANWQLTKAVFEKELIAIDKFLNVPLNVRSSTEDEFAAHLLDVHRMWCEACPPPGGRGVMGSQRPDPAPGGSADAALAPCKQKRVYVSTSTQTTNDIDGLADVQQRLDQGMVENADDVHDGNDDIKETIPMSTSHGENEKPQRDDSQGEPSSVKDLIKVEVMEDDDDLYNVHWTDQDVKEEPPDNESIIEENDEMQRDEDASPEGWVEEDQQPLSFQGQMSSTHQHPAGRENRFKLLSGAELENYLQDAESSYTRRQLKFSIQAFQDFCLAVDVDFRELSDVDLPTLDQLLGKFYAGAKSQNGVPYSRKSLQCLRYGLQKHFLYSRDLDIIKDREFAKSSRVYRTVLQKFKVEGRPSQRHKSINESDMRKIQDSLNLDTPRGLQRKVFIDIVTHFTAGEENVKLYAMEADDLILTEQAGCRYICMVDKATERNSRDDLISRPGRMFEIPWSNRCPVETLLKYKSKLNPNLPYFWQKPKKSAVEDGHWYDNVRVGINTLGSMMKTISTEAGCLIRYTNFNLRVTSISTLDYASIPSRDLMTGSGYRSETLCPSEGPIKVEDEDEDE